MNLAMKRGTSRIERRRRRWSLTDLVTDGLSGRLVEAKLWSNLGKASALGWFSWECYAGRDSEWLWLIVMGILTAHEVFVRLLAARANTEPIPSNTGNAK